MAPHETEITEIDALTQLSFVIHQTLDRRASEHDVSMVQTRLLGVLRDREPTMGELAALLDLDKSSTSGLVDRAERRGLVERSPSPTDRRASLVRLTAAGRRLTTRVTRDYESDMATMLAVLPTSDRKALSQLVTKLLLARAERAGVDLRT